MILKQYIDEYIKNINEQVYLQDIYKLIANYYNITVNQLKIDYLRKEINSSDISNITVILDKYYIQKIPLQYIIGYTYFYNEKYIVNENTLIPRPDPEVLVAEAIKYIEKYNLNTCIYMCTGTGAVGISIANNSSIKQVTLIDISDKALEVTKENITLNKVNNKCNVLNINLFANVPKESKIDILVSNPPYIKTEVINMLDEHVKKEPLLALDGGINGLDIYDRILISY